MSNINASFTLSDIEDGPTDTRQAVSFLVINSFLSVVALYVYRLMIRIVDRENFEMKTLLSNYARANIILLPLMVIIVDGLIQFWYPLSQHFGSWFCHINLFVAFLLGVYISANTLMVAIVRYISVLCNEHICGSGISRVSKIVCRAGLASSLVAASVSILLTIHTKTSPWMWINKCYGRTLEPNADIEFCDLDIKRIDTIYGDWSNSMQHFLAGGCVFDFVVEIILLSNIPEATMYCHIYCHLRRFVSIYRYNNNITVLSL